MKSILEAIREWAQTTPGHTAAADNNGKLSYLQLDELTELLASLIPQKKTEGTAFAAVYVTRTKNVITGAIAAMKAGYVYMPIDAAYPAERIDYMLSDASCCVILTESELWSKKPVDGFGESVIFLDEHTCDEAHGRAEKVRDLRRADDEPAMLLYTSGTTGRPKGVVHTYGSLSAIADTANAGSTPLSQSSRTAVFSGFTFIASAHFMFAPLYAGGSAYIVPERTCHDMDELARFLKRNGITHVFLPPSLGTLMSERYDLSDIELFFGGEKLGHFNMRPSAHITNIYGSTEGVIVLAHIIRPGEENVPLGKPCRGITIRIADEEGKEVKTGETGELWYSGPIMAKGYLNLPEQTEKAWKYLDGKRYFRTGDRVRADADGNVYYVGRADDMVKLNGFRIELGEVEQQISALGYRNFACAVRNVGGVDKLVCFYETAGAFPVGQIRQQIEKRLAAYMMPALWKPVEKLPRNANGKIVRRLLPVPEAEHREYIPPENDVEAMVVKHIEELLGMDGVGMNDCFTDLGGDSVRAMLLCSRLKHRGVILDSAAVLKAKSIRELCDGVRVRYEGIWEEGEWANIQQKFSAQGLTIEKVMPLSREQERLLMQQLLYPDDPGRIRTYSFPLDCAPAQEHLRAALDCLSQRFEALRAAVVYKDVSAIQQVITDRRLPLTVYEAENRNEAAALAESFRESNGTFSFDLQDTPQIRFCCVLIKDGTSILLASVYRFILDEARLRLFFYRLFDDLSALYPSSEELASWKKLLAEGVDAEHKISGSEEADGSYMKELLIHSIAGKERAGGPERPIFTFSAHEGGEKLIFVHTANTGSEAYYNLAKRLGSSCSFAVIEQFNIYHPEEAVYGIRNIAKKYLGFVKEYQPQGPYRLGGWCYGGMIAYEMACLLEEAGEEVDILIMLDSQVPVGRGMRRLAAENHKMVGRDYFESCPLFEDMRTRGMLEALIQNYAHVAHDVVEYTPSRYHGRVLYFKPEVVPAGASGAALLYQEAILRHKAGGYENYVDADKLEVVFTPHEHDLMMDEESLAVIVPKILSLSAPCRRHTAAIPASLEGWKRLRADILNTEGLSRELKLRLCLIAEELVSNIISYTYPQNTPEDERIMDICTEFSEGRVKMTFVYGGTRFDPRISAEEAGKYDPLMQVGGAGLLLIAGNSDSAHYEYSQGKNRFTVEVDIDRSKETGRQNEDK